MEYLADFDELTDNAQNLSLRIFSLKESFRKNEKLVIFEQDLLIKENKKLREAVKICIHNDKDIAPEKRQYFYDLYTKVMQ